MSTDTRLYLSIALSLTLALVLCLLAWPTSIAMFNPDWVLLVMMYWCLTNPERFGVGLAWLTGLWVDAATGQLLGQHGLIYSLIAYICVRFHTHLRVFPLLQQLAFVLLFLLFSQLVMFFIEILQGRPPFSWTYWLPSLTGTFAWPLVLAACSALKWRPPTQY